MKSHSLIISLILMVGYLTPVQAVTDAELEALEQQIEQQEADEQKQTEAEAKRKAEAEKLDKKKRLAELEKQRKEELRRLDEEASAEEKRRRLEVDRQVEIERKREKEAEEEQKRQEDERKRLKLAEDKLHEEKRIEEQYQARKKAIQAIQGEWKSDYGTIKFYENSDEQIAGDYSGFFVIGGTIIGSLEGNKLSGYWFQTNSASECSKKHNGYTHWGHLVFQFQNEYRDFIGKWGYCDDEIVKSWNGQKK